MKDRELLRVTLASIGDAVITTDANGRVTFLNPVAEGLTGWTQAQAVGGALDQVFRIVNEQTRNIVENPAARALREGVVVGLANHTLLIAQDGTERPIDDSAAPIRDDKGNVAGVVLVFRDVSERRRAERELQASEAHKSAILEAALDCIVSMDHNGTVLDFNPAAERTFGYRAEEAVGRSMAELIIPPRLRERHQQGLARYVATGEGPVIGKRIEMPAVRADGSEFIVELAITRVRVEGPPTFAGHLRDLTEFKRAQEAQAYMAAIVDSSDDAIISKTLDGIIATWNKGAERILGYKADEVIGRPITILVPETLPDEEAELLAVLRQGKRIEHYETVRLTRDRRLIDVSLTISPVRNPAGQIVGVSKILRDITERKQAERQIRQQAQELAEQHRRKDEFLAMLSHELRNPLAPILNATHLLRRQEPGSENSLQKEAREIIERQVTQLSRLVNDLLDISRIATGRLALHRENVDLLAIVQHARETVNPLIKQRRHELMLELPRESAWINADAARIEEVLVNLLNNAAKFTDEGGKISLTVKQANEVVIIRVSDTGVGIDQKELHHVFDLFTQVDRSLDRARGGLGIGLSLVKRLVELHGGTVAARSAGLGLGSEFEVRLPVNSQPARTPPDSGPTLSKPRARKLRMLVVDDNVDSCNSLAGLLRMSGHEVQAAYTGPTALQAAMSWNPDVILLDIGLPEMDGYEVARRLRDEKAGCEMRLVAITGYGQDKDLDLTREAGFDMHLIKPVDFAVLEQLLDTWTAAE